MLMPTFPCKKDGVCVVGEAKHIALKAFQTLVEFVL